MIWRLWGFGSQKCDVVGVALMWRESQHYQSTRSEVDSAVDATQDYRRNYLKLRATFSTLWMYSSCFFSSLSKH